MIRARIRCRLLSTTALVGGLVLSTNLAIAQEEPLRAEGFYGSVNAGGQLVPDLEVDATGGGGGPTIDVSPATGFRASGAVGYQFPEGFRAEVEGVYAQHNVDAVTGNTGGFGDRIAENDLRLYGGYGNVYYDFDQPGRLIPYVGAGAGYMFQELGDEREAALAFQGMVGVSIPLTRGALLTGGYRFQYLDEADLASGGTTLTLDETIAHGVEVGLRIPFANPESRSRRDERAASSSRRFPAERYQPPAHIGDPRFQQPAGFSDARYTGASAGLVDPRFAAAPPADPRAFAPRPTLAQGYGAGQGYVAPVSPRFEPRFAPPPAQTFSPPPPGSLPPGYPGASPFSYPGTPGATRAFPRPVIQGAPPPPPPPPGGAVQGGFAFSPNYLESVQEQQRRQGLALRANMAALNQAMSGIDQTFVNASRGLAGPFPEQTDPDLFPTTRADFPEGLSAQAGTDGRYDIEPVTPLRRAPTPTRRAASTGGGGFGVQLASYRQERNADSGWTTLQRQHGDVLSGLPRTVRRVNVPGRGQFYRLFASGLSRAEADRICRTLKLRGQYCLPSRL